MVRVLSSSRSRASLGTQLEALFRHAHLQHQTVSATSYTVLKTSKVHVDQVMSASGSDCARHTEGNITRVRTTHKPFARGTMVALVERSKSYSFHATLSVS